MSCHLAVIQVQILPVNYVFPCCARIVFCNATSFRKHINQEKMRVISYDS